MATYCDVIGNDIARNCSNIPTPNLEQKILIIPTSYLPKSGITLDGTNPDSLITAISLSSNAGRLIEGVMDKTWINHQNSLVNPADGHVGCIHMLSGIRILDPTVEKRQEINNLCFGGGTAYAIIERKWKGDSDEDAFLFFGYDFGLVVPDGGLIDNSNENDGAMVVTLQTPEGFKETYLPRVFLDTNYSTTETAVWTNKLSV